jgi:hypothetical protein
MKHVVKDVYCIGTTDMNQGHNNCKQPASITNVTICNHAAALFLRARTYLISCITDTKYLQVRKKMFPNKASRCRLK